MLKREAREILDLEDDPDLELVSRAHLRHLRVAARAPRPRRAARRTSSPSQDTIAYHAPCQQQGHWIGKPALELLALIPGLQVIEMDARCCGIAGTYGLKGEKYDIAMAVGRRPLRPGARLRRGDGVLRQRDVPLADRQGHRAPGGAPDRAPAPGVRTLGRAMVGLVVVSHSEALAEGVVALAREMGGEELALEAAGGMDEPGALGTDAERVRAAIERGDVRRRRARADGPRQRADERRVRDRDARGRRTASLMSEAPLVEGAVAAAVAARGGASLEEVAAEARGALAMKASQLGVDAAAARRARGRRLPRRGRSARCRGSARGPQRDRAARAPGRALRGGRARPRRRGPRGQGGRRRARARDEPDERGRPRRAFGRHPAGHRVGAAGGRGARRAARAGRRGLRRRPRARRGAADPGARRPGTRRRPSRRPPAATCSPASRPRPASPSGPPAASAAPSGPPPDRAADDPERERGRLDEALAAAREAIAHDRQAVAGRAGEAEAAIFDAHLALLDDEALLEPAQRGDRGRARPPSARGTTPPSRSPSSTAASTSRCCASARPTCSTSAAGSSPPSRARRPPGRRSPASSSPASSRPPRPPSSTRRSCAGSPPPTAAPPRTRRSSPARSACPPRSGSATRCSPSRRARRCCSTARPGRSQVDPGEDVLRDAEDRGERLAARRAARARARPRARRHARRRARGGLRQPGLRRRGRHRGRAGRRGRRPAAHRVPLPRPHAAARRGRAGRDPAPDRRGARRPPARRAHARRRRRQAAAARCPCRPRPTRSSACAASASRSSARRSCATQLRAILRVAAEHPLKAMFPMVATLAEVRAARALLDEARRPPASTRRSRSGSWSRSRPPR